MKKQGGELLLSREEEEIRIEFLLLVLVNYYLCLFILF